MKKTITLLLLLWSAGSLLAQPAADARKYWILLEDMRSPAVATPALSQRSLDRRARQGITLDVRDYAVHPGQVEMLRQTGVEVRQVSRWLNGVSAWLTPDQVARVGTLTGVRELRPIRPVQVDYDAPVAPAKAPYYPGVTLNQLSMIGVDRLHQNGFNGHGVLISVMDNGFRDVNVNPFLDHLFRNGQIVAVRDFVGNDGDPFDQGNHGAWVLSILAGYAETGDSISTFIGSAPGASYILCRTENDASETHQEEDNWVAAMEFADSVGADIFTTSLGYTTFDPGEGDYAYSDLDGNTAIITRAADIAASRGILVVNSAGNNGLFKISAPADGDSVMAVGAVDKNRNIAGFSSRGPSYDGRVKPDICAMGQGDTFIATNGGFSMGSGTSFSCPVLSGFAACLLQSKPSLGAWELHQTILRSGDRHANPDTVYGHGLPSAATAYQLIHNQPLGAVLPGELQNEHNFDVFPNPAAHSFYLICDNGEEPFTVHITLMDPAGRRILSLDQEILPFYNKISLAEGQLLPEMARGMYLLRVQHAGTQEILFTEKVRMLE